MEGTVTNWFTGDTHYYHPNIILYCNRPYVREGDTEIQDNRVRWKNKLTARLRATEMTEDQIREHNTLVKPEDIVWHLGDFTFGGTPEVIRLLRRLNGNYKFTWGNHDKPLKDFSTIIDHYSDLKSRVEFLGNMAEVEIEGQSIVLNHYAMRVWNKSHRGNWHLYGHSHGTLPDDPTSMSFDVGADCHDLKPIPFSRVKEIMSKKTFRPVDHHGEKLEGGGTGLARNAYAKAQRRALFESLKLEFE